MQYVRNLSARAEFLLVTTIAFGYFIAGSILSLFSPAAVAAISDDALQSLAVYEAVVFCVLSGLLWARGWERQSLGLVMERNDPLVALALSAVAYLAYLAVWFSIGRAVPGGTELPDGVIEHDLRVATVLMTSVINGAFEEIFVCGYIIAALRKSRSVFFAVNVSIAIRLSYHLYQGPVGVISVVPLGFVFAHWFARTGRLWPVAIAHCLFDILGLWAYISE